MKYTRGEKTLIWLYKQYITFTAKTSTIICKGDLDASILARSIVGFWHTDSMGIIFLLKQMQQPDYNINVIVTADKRGNYIQGILENYGAKALRMPDGMRLRPFLNHLKLKAKEPNTSLCIALDGPLGPLYQPKKLGFMLAHESGKSCVLIKVNYTKKLCIHRRWDNYVIPLPFGKITFTGYLIEEITEENLKDFKNYKKKISLLL